MMFVLYAFINQVILLRKYNIKFTLDTQGKYFTSIGAFNFIELDDNQVEVSSSQYKVIMTNLGDLLSFIRGIR